MAHLHRLFILLTMFLFVGSISAQQTKLSGTVADENRSPVAGVTVSVKGASIGTITDLNGEFSLQAPVNSTLVFSFIGYQTVEEKATVSPMYVSLKENLLEVDEVVVTALGIKKEKKALSYSITELKGDAFKIKDSNLATGLAGKVAGVNVVKPATGSMGSSRIIIRGNGSFGNNQPLYVVDGVPIDNSNFGQPGTWGGVDGGDGISSLNSDDIESMTVLKGGTAAALYGSRAANGAIVITTKQGLSGKTIVELNSSFTFDNPVVKLKDFQREYGQGLFGVAPSSLEMARYSGPCSWGSKLDGSSVIQFDGVMRPYVDAGKNNFSNFYNQASALNNNLSVSGGTEGTQYRVSVGDQRYKDLYPNSSMGRNNVSLSLHTELSKQITLRTNVMYMRERVKNRQNVNDYQSNGNVLLWTLPANIDIRSFSPAVDGNGNELLLSDMYVYFANPYFVAYNRHQKDAKDRMLGSLQLQYNFAENWYLRGRAGGDMIYRRSESVIPKGTGYNLEGNISAGSYFGGEFNAEAILGNNTRFNEKWALNTFVGWNSMAAWSESLSVYGDRFIQPNFNAVGNTETTSGGKSRSENYINSIFGQTELSFSNALFVTVAGRNDWFSALSLKGKTAPNHIFYPSAGLGFVVSQAVSLPSWIPYLKTRGSWAQSGGAVSPYSLALTYGYGQAINGNPTGFIDSGTIPNLNLKPLLSTSYEVGFDIRFLGNRLGLDATYYVRNTKDDIVNAQISSASGYNNVLINAGKISNQGVELLLTATPVKSKNVTWNSSLNFSYNKSEIKRITDNVTSFIIATSRTGLAGDQGSPAYIYQEVGEPYGIIKGYSYVRNENNQIVFDENGLPVRGEIKKLGEGVHPFTLGFSNSFSFKSFSLNILLDGKFGGSLFSGTNDMAYFFGNHKGTLYGREGGVIGQGVKQDGSINDKAVPAMDYYMYLANTISEAFVYDASFVKLREVSLGYNFPKQVVARLGLSDLTVSLVGRNLLTLYSKVPMVDPESSFTSGNAQGLEQWGLPTTQSWGFNLNVKF